MLATFDTAAELITNGKLLHIAGTESLLKKLPKGNWIGGTTEYFVTQEGGAVTDESLFVTQFANYTDWKIEEHDTATIAKIAGGSAFDNGYSIVIVPFDSAVHKVYAEKAAGFEGMFIKNIAGWVSGINLKKTNQTPLVVNGTSGEAHTDKAVVLHIGLPANLTASINIINIFEPDETSPVIEFPRSGFNAVECSVDGTPVKLAEYIKENHIDTMLPLVGNYSGSGVNTSFKLIDGDTVNFYAPVFPGIKYRMAKSIPDYEQAFNSRLAGHKDANAVFSCNCILNFLYGGLVDKHIHGFAGPVTFGEIAYQLVNQTLVYITVE
jgi:hypothetical protein